jgi:ribosomal protein S18 acetylase RimI-like enzyme
MITYIDTVDAITPDKLTGFFVGWPKPPSIETHLSILKNSAEIVLAIDIDSNRVIGFINAITDKTLAAYIPLLEVLPEYQSQGIGTELLKRMLKKLEDYYIIDLMTDPDKESFYTRHGMKRGFAMMIRNYNRQNGISE